MPGEQYCEPCERLLCGNVQSYSEDNLNIIFTHHPDANSFKEALALPCFICSFAWYREDGSQPWQGSILYGTTGLLFIIPDFDEDTLELRFHYGKTDHSSQPVALVPWKSMFPKSLLDTFILI
jgi:hypothetical protein